MLATVPAAAVQAKDVTLLNVSKPGVVSHVKHCRLPPVHDPVTEDACDDDQRELAGEQLQGQPVSRALK